MSYENLLVHRCDVYRLEAPVPSTGAFGVPVDQIARAPVYDAVPVASGVPCYFTERSQSVVQGEPNQTIFQSYLVHFLAEADIRINDKVVWDNTSFILQKPRLIRDHHKEVTAIRSDNL
ncbi:DUF3599 domain-containing protein [Domibacillus antri]|uniref:DUF3599 domain-containing protein n=1 Tax=Domibacillus antri TaxID=1714264 RepID=A0A1Q8Q3E2_9BACI|nr:DUF3599 family protein [Domibacillus antri]OLN21854.1 DUF3599 domain-containing protein [Domibacillus antri]